MDIFNFVNKTNKASKPTNKILFIGESNSGKTTQMINYFLHCIKVCCAFVIIAPEETHTDDKKLALKEWCEDAGLPLYFCTDVTYKKLPKFESESVYLIDDFYISSDRNKTVEKLLKELINLGRHTGIHVLYAAHLTIHLPFEIKLNSSKIFLNAAIAVNPKTYERLQIRDASEDAIKKTKDSFSWFIYDSSNVMHARVTLVEWPKVKNREALIAMIKKKIPAGVKLTTTETLTLEASGGDDGFTMADVIAGKYYDKRGGKKKIQDFVH